MSNNNSIFYFKQKALPIEDIKKRRKKKTKDINQQPTRGTKIIDRQRGAGQARKEEKDIIWQ